MQTKRVFLIHGWDGRPDNHWFPWLKRGLEGKGLPAGRQGFRVESLEMPNPAHPKVSEWVGKIRESVGEPSKDDYFVGHSLGCISILRYIAGLPEHSKVGGCVFVGGFSGNVGEPDIAEFYTLPYDAEAVKKHCKNFVSIASDDDSLVPLEKSVEMNNQIGGKLIVEQGKGHFCKSDGVTELPSVLNSILEISGSTLNSKL